MAELISSLLENNILYPVGREIGEKAPQADISGFKEKPFVEYLFEKVRKDVEEKGDREWLTNGAFLARGSSRVFGCETVKISEVESISWDQLVSQKAF